MKLVFIENNRPVTDSLTVAEAFGKRHSDVLRSIENLDCSQEFNERNFALVDYKDVKGEMRPKYFITQDGFSFLVMGYTGKEAARFKEMYIHEFNALREKVKNNVSPLDERTVRIALLKTAQDHEERLEDIEIRIEAVSKKVDEQITLDSGAQRKVQKSIARRIYEIESESSVRSECFRQLHREIRDRWAVASYKDVRRNELDGLIKYIEAWIPRKSA
jgi:Rha family phage regulatory protein